MKEMKMVQTARNEHLNATFTIKSPNHSSIINSLRGEDVEIFTSDNESTIKMDANSLKDLRAYWNTMLRSLEAADSVLSEIEGEDK